jgi:putative hydrolase of the HAD superfamily
VLISIMSGLGSLIWTILYPADTRLFDQIETRMVTYITRELGVSKNEADRLRGHYWATYGTTLSGLMHEHGIAPEPFLDEVHDIDFSVLDPAPDLSARIAALPGRRIIYTNGDTVYARRVLASLGLDEALFAAIYGIEHADFRPKPEQAAFDRVFGRDGFDPALGAMFEDDPRNLAVPHRMGLRTVLVGPTPAAEAHIDHHTDDLSHFLSRLTD